MLSLPLLNVRLRACSKDRDQMTPTAQGQHCAHCNRVVLDFTQSSAADLEAAFRTAPDGRVCGRLRADQLAADQPAPLPAHPTLRPKLRRFLVALLLVCGLGLGVQEALAQVRQAVQTTPNTHQSQAKQASATPAVHCIEPTVTVHGYDGGTIGLVSPPVPEPDANGIYTYVEQMPAFERGAEAMQAFLVRNLRFPSVDSLPEGRVFVRCIVTKTGHLRTVELVKGIHPMLDAEALRVVVLMDGKFTPGRKQGENVDVHYNLAIPFSRTK